MAMAFHSWVDLPVPIMPHLVIHGVSQFLFTCVGPPQHGDADILKGIYEQAYVVFLGPLVQDLA